jgi:hypothetical protein
VTRSIRQSKSREFISYMYIMALLIVNVSFLTVICSSWFPESGLKITAVFTFLMPLFWFAQVCYQSWRRRLRYCLQKVWSKHCSQQRHLPWVLTCLPAQFCLQVLESLMARNQDGWVVSVQPDILAQHYMVSSWQSEYIADWHYIFASYACCFCHKIAFWCISCFLIFENNC